MTPRQTEIFDKLSDLLAPLNKKGITLKPDTKISVELDIDSVAIMDFIMEVEDQFDIDIPLNVLQDTHTMSDLVQVVESRAS